MGLFSRKKEEKKEQSSDKKKTVSVGAKDDEKKNKGVGEEKKTRDDGKKEDAKKATIELSENAEMAYRFILRPWITEKTQELLSENKYVFRLRPKVTKKQVKEAVEKLYNVKIDKINIINIPQKKRRFGRIVGKKSAVKKAVVSLKKGYEIEIFK